MAEAILLGGVRVAGRVEVKRTNKNARIRHLDESAVDAVSSVIHRSETSLIQC
jgi:hypothetical protein